MKGITFIELLIVLVIMSILLAVALPAWNDPQFLSADAAAQQLKQDINFAQQYAFNHNNYAAITFNSNTAPSSYSFSDANGTTIPNPYDRQNTTTMPSGVSVTAAGFTTGSAIYFDGEGIPYLLNGSTKTLLASNITLTLQAGANSVTLTVYANTGFVQ
jgi:prepilin-type N-terminal cleavage/methylation domain-containing protein